MDPDGKGLGEGGAGWNAGTRQGREGLEAGGVGMGEPSLPCPCFPALFYGEEACRGGGQEAGRVVP